MQNEEVKFGDHLNSINLSKKNIIRDGGAPEVAEKTYSPFLVQRSMSYHADQILIVNELNAHGRSEHSVSKKMHYEYLFYALPKKKRFAKWAKPYKDTKVRLIMDKYCYSYQKALEVVDLFSDEELKELDRVNDQGGLSGSKKAGKKK